MEHYYHFIFDLLLPLHTLFLKANDKTSFSISDFGILRPILDEIFGNRVEIIDRSNAKRTDAFKLRGMDPRFVKIHYSVLKSLKGKLCEKLKIEPNHKPNKVLLIERIPPQEYFQKEAVHKGAGSTRRSIKNHQELKIAIRSALKPEFHFQNIQLEEMNFSEQIQCFDSAIMVIGQHGAGLSNIIWMKQSSTVVEIGFESKDHFRILSKVMRHTYISVNQNEAHVQLDVEIFLKNLKGNKLTNRYFK